MNQSNNNNQNNNSGNRPPNSSQGGKPGGQKRGFHGRGRPQNQNSSPNQANRQNAQGGQNPQGQQGQGGNPNQRRPHRGPQHNRPRHPNQNNHQNSQPPQQRGERDVVFERYDQLRTEHMAARKKYYEMFGTPDYNLKKKLEITFNKTIEALTNYEKTLQPIQREALLKKIELYDYDLTYSQNRELLAADAPAKSAFGLYPALPGLLDTPPEAPFQDPHYLQTQVNRPSFKEDAEESVGSIEDYKKLKGL